MIHFACFYLQEVGSSVKEIYDRIKIFLVLECYKAQTLRVFFIDIKVSGKFSNVSSRYPHVSGDACWPAMLKLHSLE